MAFILNDIDFEKIKKKLFLKKTFEYAKNIIFKKIKPIKILCIIALIMIFILKISIKLNSIIIINKIKFKSIDKI